MKRALFLHFLIFFFFLNLMLSRHSIVESGYGSPSFQGVTVPVSRVSRCNCFNLATI